MFVKLSVVAALAALVNAAPAPIKHVLHETRSTPASDWVKGARIEKSAVIPLRIGLSQTNLEKGYDYLMEVSHPDSENYGKHWTAQEVHDMFSPEEETVANIRQWLSDFGIHDGRVVHSQNKGWIAVDVTVEEAEDLLKTEYYEHEHKYSSKVRVGCDEYHVPEHLTEHIDYITPGIKLTPVVKRTRKTKRGSYAVKAPLALKVEDSSVVSAADLSLPPSLANCGNELTPTCIKALYSIPNATLATPGNSLGLYEQGSYFAESDVNLFFAKYTPEIPQGTFPINASIDGASYSVPAGNLVLNNGEGNLDIAVVTALIYPQTITLYQTDDDIYEMEEVATTNVFNTFLDALDGSYCTYTSNGETGDDPTYDAVYPHDVPGGYMGQLECGVYTPTKVISASYGQAEADLPAPYVLRQCNEFMKLGLQGISILFASGDYGVASFPLDMGTPGTSGCLGIEGTVFNPQYPSGCPYVTSVGGSQLAPNGTVYDPEVVMQDNLGGTAVNFSSSGGFSNYFPRPTYQDGHVETYFHRAHLTYPYYSELNVDTNTTTGMYNRIGRAYPDVSANGAHFPSYLNGSLYSFYGASLASPIFASVLTLINEERAAIGKSSVGFINPTLYKHDNVLNDVTAGHNLGCGTEGFSAVEGWDPATGLGTPNYPKMLELFLSLP